MICNQCPRRCNALRDNTSGAGWCKMPRLPVVARAALHFWEEPVISGSRGSGAVFFSGCPLGCVFCQNDPISHKNFGKTVSVQRLSDIFKELEDQGAHNINLVNPTHFAHILPEAIEKSGVKLPFVWNSGGYDTVDTVRALSPYISVWLPDLKYLSPEKSSRYSQASNYPEVATAAILEMYKAAGPLQITHRLLTRGLLIRHLLLPAGLLEAKSVMDWVAANFPPGSVLFSLMGQYIPLGKAADFPEINRVLRQSELRSAITYMNALGLDGFTQDAASAQETYIPPFDLTGV